MSAPIVETISESEQVSAVLDRRGWIVVACHVDARDWPGDYSEHVIAGPFADLPAAKAWWTRRYNRPRAF